MKRQVEEKGIDILFTALLVILYFYLVSPYLQNPSWEMLDSWRQGDTYSVALEYFRNGMDLFHPKFTYFGPTPQVVQLELMALPALGTFLAQFYPFSPVIFRVISATAFALSSVFLYNLVRIKSERDVAFFAALFYLLTPFGLYYGRAIMPESLALMGYMGGFYFLALWEESEKFSHIILSALFLGFGLLEKLTLGFLGIVPVVIMLRKFKLSFLKKPEFYLYGLLSLILPLLYYYLVQLNAVETFVTQIYGRLEFPTQLFEGDGFSFIYENMLIGFGPILTFFGLGGFLFALYKKDLFYITWYLSLCISMVTVFSGIRLPYYLIFWLPLLCALTAEWIGLISHYFPRFLICGGIALFLFFQGTAFMEENAKEDPYLSEALELVIRYIPMNSYIAVNGENPIIITASGNRGDRVPMTEEASVRDLKNSIDEGLEYYVFLKYLYMDNAYLSLILENGEMIQQNDAAVIYRMNGQDE